MADPENYKSISLDIETYNLLKTVAEAECRRIGMQVRWMIKQGMVNPPSPNITAMPTAPATVKAVRVKPRGKIFTNSGTAQILVRFFETNATLSVADFRDIEVEDVYKTIVNIEAKGELRRIGHSKPGLWHITPRGVAKAREILRRRVEEEQCSQVFKTG